MEITSELYYTIKVHSVHVGTLMRALTRAAVIKQVSLTEAEIEKIKEWVDELNKEVDKTK